MKMQQRSGMQQINKAVAGMVFSEKTGVLRRTAENMRGFYFVMGI